MSEPDPSRVTEVLGVTLRSTPAFAVGATIAASDTVTVTTSAVEVTTLPTETRNSNTYVPTADAVNVGFTTEELDNDTAGPDVFTHAYVNDVPTFGFNDPEPSNVTTVPVVTAWSTPASAVGDANTVTVTVSAAEVNDPSDTVKDHTYVPATVAANVGFTTEGFDSDTAGPDVFTHAYVNVVPGSGSEEPEPSSTTEAPTATD